MIGLSLFVFLKVLVFVLSSSLSFPFLVHTLLKYETRNVRLSGAQSMKQQRCTHVRDQPNLCTQAHPPSGHRFTTLSLLWEASPGSSIQLYARKYTHVLFRAFNASAWRVKRWPVAMLTDCPHLACPYAVRMQLFSNIRYPSSQLGDRADHGEDRSGMVIAVVTSSSILSVIVVSMRFYVRLAILRSPGWDDFLLLLATV